MLGTVLEALYELDDLWHLFAHNFAGNADSWYFSKRRHKLAEGKTTTLSCGARFEGGRIQLAIPHLRYYTDRADDALRALQ